MEFNYDLEMKAEKANRWWKDLPMVTRIAIYADLKGIEEE